MANGNTPEYQLVYAIESVKLKIIKIGFTTDLHQRLHNLQGGCPDELRIKACWPGTVNDEREIHRRFDAFRVQGEWFNPSDEVLAYIAERDKSRTLSLHGLMRLEFGDGNCLDFWATCRASKASRYNPRPHYSVLADVVRKAEQLAASLPAHHGYLADQIAIDAKTAYHHIEKGNLFERIARHCPLCIEYKDGQDEGERHIYEVTADKGHVFSAFSEYHAILLWLKKFPENRRWVNLRVDALPDATSLPVHSGDGGAPIVRTHREWADTTQGFIGTRIEPKPKQEPIQTPRHCFLVQSSRDYVYSAPTKREALQSWLKEYWPADGDGVSNVSIKQLPDAGRFNFHHSDEAKTVESKTYQEWAESKEGFVAIFTQCFQFDYPPMAEVRAVSEKLTTENEGLRQTVAALESQIHHLQQPKLLTWQQRLKGKVT